MPIQKRSTDAFITEIHHFFGGDSVLARQTISHLYCELAAQPELSGFLQWQALRFDATACDPCVWQKHHDLIARKLLLPNVLPLPVETRAKNSAALQFAIESYFAQVVQSFLRRIGYALPDVATIYEWPNETRTTNRRSLFFLATTEIDAVVARLSELGRLGQSNRGIDLFGGLYENLLPGAARKQLGEFYTPTWLAEHLLDVAGFHAAAASSPSVRLLDPSCGSGTFLLAAVRRMLQENVPAEQIATRVAGFDLNPLAVLMSTANVAMTLVSHDAHDKRLMPNGLPPLKIACHDSIRNTAPLAENDAANAKTTTESLGSFDFIVGNPPWLAWDRLPREYREKTMPLWQRYGLFNLSGKDARYGGAKKELAILMTATVTDCFLKPGGRLALVLPQTILQTHKSGDGFRRFGGENLPYQLKVLRVDDFSAMRVFKDAATKTATLVFEKGKPTTYPVPYYRWPSPDHCVRHDAEPVAPDRPGSAWRVVPHGTSTTCRHVNPMPHANHIDKPQKRSETSDYKAQLGANTGGANGVYWVEIVSPSTHGHVIVRNLVGCGKQTVPVVEAEIEADLLYPLLRWRDVDRFSAIPSTWSIITQNPVTRTGLALDVIQEKYPKTLDFLRKFEPQLRNRAAFKKFLPDAPFYSMYNISQETFAPVKVVWRRMDTRIRAAVVQSLNTTFAKDRSVIPQETCSMIAANHVDEAYYLAATLNSESVHVRVAAFSVQGGKGFGSPGMLNHLPIRTFDPTNESHRQLARLGQTINDRQATECDDIRKEIDAITERMFVDGTRQ